MDNILPDLNNNLNKNQIYVATLSFINSHITILDAIKPHTLIVDEATQILEYDLLAVLSNTKRWILIGDENQLPAVVLQNDKSSTDTMIFTCRYKSNELCPLSANIANEKCYNKDENNCKALKILNQIHLNDFSEPLLLD